MIRKRLAVLALSLTLACAIGAHGVGAQTETATAEDGNPVVDGSATTNSSTTTTTTAPTVPIGANLAPPVGIAPPIIAPAGTGQPGSSSVSMAPGTLTSGVAREGRNANRAPEETTNAPSTETAVVSTCGDFPTWYDAQLTLESATDPLLIESLDPDMDTIACEDVMYPDS